MLSKQTSDLIDEVFEPYMVKGCRAELKTALSVSGPNKFCVRLYELLGFSGISLFGLAGLRGVPPRRLLAQLRESRSGINLGYCYSTRLPVLNSSWGGGGFESYHEDELSDEMGSYDDWAADMEVEECPAYLPNMLKKYGGRSWKKHCTRTFAPFNTGTERHMTAAQWTAARKVLLSYAREKRKAARSV